MNEQPPALSKNLDKDMEIAYARWRETKNLDQEETRLDLFLLAVAVGRGSKLTPKERTQYANTYEAAKHIAQTLWGLRFLGHPQDDLFMRDDFLQNWLVEALPLGQQMANYGWETVSLDRREMYSTEVPGMREAQLKDVTCDRDIKGINEVFDHIDAARYFEAWGAFNNMDKAARDRFPDRLVYWLYSTSH